jgi:hypothetical protein
MKNILYIIIALFISFTNIRIAYASHAMGSETTWTCIGQDSFLVKCVAYRDCNGIYLSNFPISFKCNTGQNITTLTSNIGSPVDITPFCFSSCSRCQSLSCMFPFGIHKFTSEVLVYLGTAGNCCNVVISWVLGPRSSAATTITGSGSDNIYSETKLNRCLNPCDNSPVYTNPALTILCSGQDFSYNFGVQDYDTNNTGGLSDSLTYEWTSPLNGANNSQVQYLNQYSYDKPLYFWDFPNTFAPSPRGFHLDPNTGDIQFRPMKSEVTVMTIKVNEFRNGVKIAEIRRDMQVAIINCFYNVAPKISTSDNLKTKSTCAGRPVSFNFTTSDTNTNDSVFISWNNALPGATWSSTNGQTKRPTATLTWTPTQANPNSLPYTFTVSARDNACPINSTYTTQYSISVSQIPLVTQTYADTGCGKFFFNTQVLQGSGIKYNWQGDGGMKSTKSKFIYQFPKKGLYHYSLIYGVSNYCGDTLYDSVNVDKFLYTTKSKDTTICAGDTAHIWVQGFDNSGPVNYSWNTGDTTRFANVKPPISSWIWVYTSDTTQCPKMDTVYIKVNPAPVISLNQDQTICQDQSITLTASGGVTYIWNTGEKVANITKTPSASTLYTVSVTNFLHCSANDSVLITVLPLPKVNAGPDDTMCSFNGDQFLSNSLDTVPGTHYWSGNFIYFDTLLGSYFNTGNIGIINKQPNPLTYVYTDTNGCSNRDTFNLVVFKLIPANAGADRRICLNGNPVQLNGSPAGGSWIGRGVHNTYFYPDSAGTGNYPLIYTYLNFCSSNDTSFFTVLPLPSVTANTNNGRNIFCPTENKVKLIGNPVGGQYGGYWTGNVENGNYFNPNKTDGKYVAYYHFTDQDGCTNTDSIELFVKSPFISIDYTQKMVCFNNNITFSATSWGGDYITWFNDPTANGRFLTFPLDNPVIYTPGVSEYTNGGFWMKVKTFSSVCNSAADSIYINTGYPPIADFAGTSDSNFVPLEIYFTNLSVIPNGYVKYSKWYFGDGDSSDERNPVHTYLKTGKYDVKLIAISSIGCSDTAVKEDYITVLSGIKDAKNDPGLKLFPNPAKEFIYIVSAKPDIRILSVQMSDIYGKLVFLNNTINKNAFRIERGNLFKGIYLVKVRTNNGNEYIGRVVLE